MQKKTATTALLQEGAETIATHFIEHRTSNIKQLHLFYLKFV